MVIKLVRKTAARRYPAMKILTKIVLKNYRLRTVMELSLVDQPVINSIQMSIVVEEIITFRRHVNLQTGLPTTLSSSRTNVKMLIVTPMMTLLVCSPAELINMKLLLVNTREKY